MKGAEIQLGLAFGVVGGFFASRAHASTLTIVVVAACLASIGAAVAHDCKRRMMKMLEETSEQEER